ncbi:hypothetical protein [Paracidovorax cattleyae]|uniref:Uncharacterized protein n=1 Tax=Paracidovorax cattleyae TaxID=80868 RepID=A0A1H0UQ14_9BURK|nr:hypothetical protein [Paracidovorax cattleyae]MBF9264136.1 hypothetical protein [Paracidovorax cattleyae]SDP68173.1 hypothetical protein SAMN04489708_12124 [Paracidovorax cattleyae]
MNRFLLRTSQIVLTVAVAQWVFLAIALGYQKWGLIGAFLGGLASVPTLALSPVLAFFLMDGVSLAWFFGLLAVALVTAFFSSRKGAYA